MDVIADKIPVSLLVNGSRKGQATDRILKGRNCMVVVMVVRVVMVVSVVPDISGVSDIAIVSP